MGEQFQPSPDSTLWCCTELCRAAAYLGCVLGDLAHQCGDVLPHILVRVPEAGQHSGEDLSLHHQLGQIH